MSEDEFKFVYDDRCKTYLDEELARKIYEKLGYETLHDVCRSIGTAYEDGYNNGWSDGYEDGYEDGYNDAEEGHPYNPDEYWEDETDEWEEEWIDNGDE